MSNSQPMLWLPLRELVGRIESAATRKYKGFSSSDVKIGEVVFSAISNQDRLKTLAYELWHLNWEEDKATKELTDALNKVRNEYSDKRDKLLDEFITSGT